MSRSSLTLRGRPARLLGAGASVVVVAAALTGCAGGAAGDPPGTVDVVASTNVWGDIAGAVGGRWVSVHSIISEPDQDPHSFEASARTLLEVKQAGLVIENGGGYDDYMGRLLDAAGTSAPVLNAVSISDHTAPPGGELNEHVFYDLPTAARVADRVAVELGRLQPRHAASFESNAARFGSGVRQLEGVQDEVRASYAGTGVGITEPLPLYMLDAMGLRDLTPPAFSDAVESGGDVAARVLAETLDLYQNHRVAVLVYNVQTDSAVTEQVKAAARDNGVPVVPVSETLPPGTSYLAWMRHNIARVAEALSRS